jgi:hypothetical protein
MQQLGLLTVNDIRKIFNKAETEGGENVFITTNTQPLSAPKVDPLLENGEPVQDEPEPEINNTNNSDDNGNT